MKRLIGTEKRMLWKGLSQGVKERETEKLSDEKAVRTISREK